MLRDYKNRWKADMLCYIPESETSNANLVLPSKPSVESSTEMTHAVPNKLNVNFGGPQQMHLPSYPSIDITPLQRQMSSTFVSLPREHAAIDLTISYGLNDMSSGHN